jgi:hypothetical protein
MEQGQAEGAGWLAAQMWGCRNREQDATVEQNESSDEKANLPQPAFSGVAPGMTIRDHVVDFVCENRSQATPGLLRC